MKAEKLFRFIRSRQESLSQLSINIIRYKVVQGGSLLEVDLICSLNMLNINESLLRLSVTDYDY